MANHVLPARIHRTRTLIAAAAVALLAACGGGGGDDVVDGIDGGPFSCSVGDQKTWLRNYFNDWYFWYRLSPNPAPAAYASVSGYFDALLYTGVDASFPADRWSNYESTASFNRFFGEGQTLGYGVTVAGREVSGLPSQPLYVRYVEPLSPAAGAAVVRGDRVMSINGRSAADLIAADDFDALTATTAGQQITLVLRNAAGVDRSVTLASAIYALSPVPRSQVVTTPLGRRLGYVVVKDMISQASSPLASAFADFRAQGVSDVVIDLRYNGGGLVSVGASLASYVTGSRAAGQTYSTLLFNDKRATANNESFTFSNPPSALGITRAYVLTGRRTCSSSEQVINGLRGVGVQVISIGETTCGKPVGFVPQEDGCGTTYSVVNFESVNARNEGRYFDGFAATCAVAEDFTKPLGTTIEPLLAAARTLADGGACPVAATGVQPMSLRRATAGPEPGERRGMIPR
jgi:carboxyl-terminal processing protease